MQGFEEQSADRARPRHAVVDATHADGVSAAVPPVLSPATSVALQRLAGNAAVSRLAQEEQAGEGPGVLDVVGRGGGRPLDTDVRADMEARLGQPFDDVRIHTDGTAAASARSVQAHAYTVGNEVVFNQGQYDPASDTGRQTIAHELTHVVQQRSGPVDGTEAPGGIRLSDPADRFEQEAERTAHDALAADGHQPVPGVASVAAAGGVQREAAPEEEKKDEETPALQGRFVQREEEMADELDEHR